MIRVPLSLIDNGHEFNRRHKALAFSTTRTAARTAARSSLSDLYPDRPVRNALYSLHPVFLKP